MGQCYDTLVKVHKICRRGGGGEEYGRHWSLILIHSIPQLQIIAIIDFIEKYFEHIITCTIALVTSAQSRM